MARMNYHECVGEFASIARMNIGLPLARIHCDLSQGLKQDPCLMGLRDMLTLSCMGSYEH